MHVYRVCGEVPVYTLLRRNCNSQTMPLWVCLGGLFECVYMGGGADAPGDEVSHPSGTLPPQGVFILFERPAFHWGWGGGRRLKPSLSQSNGRQTSGFFCEMRGITEIHC